MGLTDNAAQLEEGLREKVLKAMDYLEIPLYEKRNDGSNLPVHPINQTHLCREMKYSDDASKNAFNPFMLQALHEMRVGLYAVLLINHLKITDKEWKHNMFAAYLCHDYGKDLIIGPNDCFPINVNHKFGSREETLVKNHVSLDIALGNVFNPIVTSIIERHHYYRKHDPYPKKPKTLETPEVKYLAQMLGIVDFYDAASTRINRRTQQSLLGKILGRKFQSQRSIRNMLFDEYGDQQLSYQGKHLPHAEKTGRQFIEEMYAHRIFGRKNRLNPFEDIF